MDTTSILLGFALSIPGGFIGVVLGLWYTKKYLFSPQNVMEMADSVLDYAVNTEEGKAKLNILGKWVVSNLMSNVKGSVGGMMPKTKDIIPMLLLGLAQRYLPGFLGQNPPPNQQEQSNQLQQADSNPFKH